MKRMLFLVVVPFLLYSQWSNISGPGNTSITAMTKKGNALIVGTDLQGIHVTMDQGDSWRSISGNLSNFSVQSILATSTHIFAGITAGSDKGLYRSTNNGVSWTKYTSPFPNSTINCLIKVDTVIFAGAVGMYRSVDGGVSFQAASSGIPGGNKITALTNNGTTIFAASDAGIYRSTNLGGIWTEVRKNTLYTELSYSITSANGNIYYASYNGGVNSGKDSIYKSTNNGDTWISIKSNLPSYLYGQYLMSYGDTVFYGMQSDKIFRSTNAGQSWHVDSVGMDNRRTQCGLIDGSVIYSGGNYYVSSGITGTGGLYVSTNNGNNWTRKFSNIHNGDINGFAQVGTKLVLSVNGQKEKGIFLSLDKGATWKKSSSGLTVNGGVPVYLSQLFEKNGKLFAFANSNVPNGVFASFDSGATWQSASSGLYQYATVNSFYSDADTIYGALKEGLFRTTNNGTSWQAWGTGLPTSNIKGIVIKNDTMYASNGTKTLYRSLNRGRTWTSITTNQTTYVPYQLYVYNNKLVTVTGNKVYWCADTGATWTEVNGGVFGFSVHSILIWNKHLLVNVTSKGLYHTNNDGNSWTQINTGLHSLTPSITSFTVAWDTLYVAVSGGGIFRRALVDAGITSIGRNNTKRVPIEISLSQNYPNPFNPTTNIEFQIPHNGFVTLKVYDAIGREVVTLANEQMNVGSYKTSFNGAGLASGVYFYRLSMGNYSDMKKMMLMK